MPVFRRDHAQDRDLLTTADSSVVVEMMALQVLLMVFVMAGLDPAIHVLGGQEERGCPGQARA
jgi:hypothetical protein